MVDKRTHAEIEKLKEKHGNVWKRKYKIKRVWPFGRKSKPEYYIIRRKRMRKKRK